jgi:Rod binding domain-containing protein
MDNNSVPRELAKWLILSAISFKTTQFTSNTVDNYTRFNKDSLAVSLVSGGIGMVVANQLEPVTEKIVDKTANFINEKRAKRSAKKDAKKND